MEYLAHSSFSVQDFTYTYTVQMTRWGRDPELSCSGSVGASWFWVAPGGKTAC